MAFGDDVHNQVKRIDARMLALVDDLRKFGVPKGMGTQLNKTRDAVGNLVAKMTMTQRRS